MAKLDEPDVTLPPSAAIEECGVLIGRIQVSNRGVIWEVAVRCTLPRDHDQRSIRSDWPEGVPASEPMTERVHEYRAGGVVVRRDDSR